MITAEADDEKPGEKIHKCEIECPKCHQKWAELTFGFNAGVEPADLRVLDGSKVFKEGDDMTCSKCSYAHKTSDIWLSIANWVQLNKEDNPGKLTEENDLDTPPALH